MFSSAARDGNMARSVERTQLILDPTGEVQVDPTCSLKRMNAYVGEDEKAIVHTARNRTRSDRRTRRCIASRHEPRKPEFSQYFAEARMMCSWLRPL